MDKRTVKDLLYEQVARIGKAVSSPKRLELLELLAQGQKSVEDLAGEISIDGKFVFYRLASADVASLWVALRDTAQDHLIELSVAVSKITATPDKLADMSRAQLLEEARKGTIILIDVRPQAEFAQSHLPYARSMPLDEIEHRIKELPKSKEIVAYCRGPFCVFAEEAARLLRTNHRKVSKLNDGVAEWHAAGMPLESEEVQ